MSQLTPCPECQRHVRKTEARCPFCDSALSLAHVPPPVLPRQRLSRAATFAFGASVVSATALAACGGDVEQRPDGQAGASSAGGSFYAGGFNIYGAPPSGAANGGSGVAGNANGGSGVAGSANGGVAGSANGGGAPTYGAPPPIAGTGPTAGAGPEGGAGGAAGDGGVDYGGGLAIYGGPPAGTGGV